MQELKLASPKQHSSLSFLPLISQTMGRPSCCDKLNVKRGLWKAEEDAKLLACISKYGCGNWTLVPKKAGLNRCGKSCRLRWTNYLKPDLKHDNFTSQEEDLIINLHRAIGSRWSMIARELPGRTDNDVKNYWNTKLRKKLSNMGIDPVTHKPISHVLSDYENLSCFPKSTANCQATSFNKESSSACIGSYPYANMMLRSAIHQQFKDKTLSTDLSPQLLSQFQTMNQVYGTYQPFILNEITSSCSSSSSSTASHVTELSSPTSFSCQQSESQISPCSLNWTGYLLHDPCVQSGELQDEQNHGFLGSFSSTNLGSLLQNDTSQLKFNIESECRAKAIEDEGCSQSCGVGSTIGTSNQAKGCSSSSNSFVNSILDRDTEMRGLFPEFFDGYSDF